MPEPSKGASKTGGKANGAAGADENGEELPQFCSLSMRGQALQNVLPSGTRAGMPRIAGRRRQWRFRRDGSFSMKSVLAESRNFGASLLQ